MTVPRKLLWIVPILLLLFCKGKIETPTGSFTALYQQLCNGKKVDSLVLKPSYKKGEFDSHAIDAPFLFKHEEKYYMTFIGWDGTGYRTGLASSDDLIHWTKEGLIIDRGPKGSPTEFNVAMTWILRDNDLFGSGELKQVDGYYIGTYHAYPQPGYEVGSAVIGISRSKDLKNWTLDPPSLFCTDGGYWEAGGLYKSCLLEHNGTYYLFYNAKRKGPHGLAKEQSSFATSTDLKNWTRSPENPVIPAGKEGSFDDVFASDPCVLKIQDGWALFYYSLDSKGVARDCIAFSKDLVHWQKADKPILDVGPPGSYDSKYAHKPGIITKDGVIYHFYCAVSPNPSGKIGEIENNETRGIGLAVCKRND